MLFSYFNFAFLVDVKIDSLDDEDGRLATDLTRLFRGERISQKAPKKKKNKLSLFITMIWVIFSLPISKHLLSKERF